MKGIIGAIIGNSVGKQYAIKPTTDYDFRMLYDKSNPGDDSIAISFLPSNGHIKIT